MRLKHRALLVATAVVMAVTTANPALGHNLSSGKASWLYGSPTMCTWGEVRQNHAQREFHTSAYGGGGSCAYGFATIYGQAEQFYKARPGQPAEYCGSLGWSWSTTRALRYDRVFYDDLWSSQPCNYGVGVHVNIFIDSWQYAEWGGNWYGNAWRPATVHCHCP